MVEQGFWELLRRTVGLVLLALALFALVILAALRGERDWHDDDESDL